MKSAAPFEEEFRTFLQWCLESTATAYAMLLVACRAAKLFGKAGTMLKEAGSSMAHQAQAS